MPTGSEPNAAFQTTDNQQLDTYQAVSALAIVGVILGVLSSLVLVQMAFIAIAAAAVFVCILALIKINKSEGRLVGRKPAIVGLAIACFFLAYAPVRDIVEQTLLYHQAKPMADLFVETLTNNEPHKAEQLTKYEENRQPIDAHLWEYYRKNSDARNSLLRFVREPLIQALLNLRNKAKIRFYGFGGMVPMSKRVLNTELIYAITYENAGRKTSSFFSIIVERNTKSKDGIPAWRVAKFVEGVEPLDRK